VIRPVLAEGEAPAAQAALALAAGVWSGSWSVGGAASGWALLVVSAAALAGLAGKSGRSSAFRLAFAAFWLAAGFLSGRIRIADPAEIARTTFLALGALSPAAVTLEGRLTDFWNGMPPRARATLAAESVAVSGRGRPFPGEIAVFIAGEESVASVADRGDRVRLTGHLEAEEMPASERDLALPWPRYRASVKSARLLEREAWTPMSLLTLPNRALFAAIPSRGGPAFERDVRGPLAALLLGRTAELDRGMVARYRRGGLYHLLVVSGLHVVLAAGLASLGLRALRVEGRSRDVALLVSVALFVLVGGANPPAVRAGLVVGILVATRLLERPIASGQAIGLSALILLLCAPKELFSVGTVLTFAAVSGIALFTTPIRERLPRRPAWLFSGLAVSLAAQCATAPILFWRFNVVAAGAWLTAPVTLPLAGALVAGGGILLVLYLIGIPAAPVAGLFAFGSRALEFLAERAAGCAFLRPTPRLAAVAAVGILLILAGLGPGRARPWAAAASAMLFAVLVVAPGPAGPDRGFSIEALDVGQGDAILLRWNRRAILVDGGGPFDPMATDFGRTRLVPKLLDRGVTRLDAVLATHPHPDHALGLFAALEELEVGELWQSTGEDENDLFARLDRVAASRGVRVRPLEARDVWEREGARISVLRSGGLRRKTDGINNQSVVALFERDGRSALLTGDAGAPSEAALAEAGLIGPVDVLKVGHHGSRTATTPRFVEAARPRVALLSCGRRNRFGHPAPETLATLERFCVPVLRTDERSDERVDLLPKATRLWWRGLASP
jgi:competence protein ComEC